MSGRGQSDSVIEVLKEEIENSLQELKQIYNKFSYLPHAYRDNSIYGKINEFHSTLGSLLNAADKSNREYAREFSQLAEKGYREYSRQLQQLLGRITEGKERDIISHYAQLQSGIAAQRRNGKTISIDVKEKHNDLTIIRTRDIEILQSRLTYTDMGLLEYGPCLMRALIGIAESFIGTNLTLAELSDLENTLTSGANPIIDNVGTFEVNGKSYPSYYVNDPQSVIVESLKILDSGNTYDVEIAAPGSRNYNEIREKADASFLAITGHWQEGNRYGNFRWDPFYRLDNDDKEILETRYVSITRKTNVIDVSQ